MSISMLASRFRGIMPVSGEYMPLPGNIRYIVGVGTLIHPHNEVQGIYTPSGDFDPPTHHSINYIMSITTCVQVLY